jgi:hypothetical protein
MYKLGCRSYNSIYKGHNYEWGYATQMTMLIGNGLRGTAFLDQPIYGIKEYKDK